MYIPKKRHYLKLIRMFRILVIRGFCRMYKNTETNGYRVEFFLNDGDPLLVGGGGHG